MVVYQAVQWDKMIEETAEVEKKKKKTSLAYCYIYGVA